MNKPEVIAGAKGPRDAAWGANSAADGPLWQIKVLDLTHARAGPTCVRQLTDWGARALKIEQPGGGGDVATDDRHGFDFQNLHRNKRSLSLNLKDPDGLAIFKELAKEADVIVENFRPAVKDRLGIAYETIHKINPRIIYASLSGFGDTGPYRDRPGVDQIAQGLGGLMSITGLPGQGPVRVGIPICDLTAGIFLSTTVLMALYERERSGEGQWVKTSLLSAMIQMLDFQATRWLIGKEVPPQAGNDHPTGIPTGVFKTKDGHMNIAASGNKLFMRLADALGKPEWKTDPVWSKAAERRKNKQKMNAMIDEITVTKTADEWVNILNEAGVPSGPIYSIDQMFADPQVKQLGQVKPVKHKKLNEINVVGQAATMSRTPSSIRLAAPDAGEHTEAVLQVLGYDTDRIAELKKRHVV
jgi:crotonobetainyl-CoA:carnitine CoA-transferase CaiB-like acyl-CoA transferase